MKDRIFAQLRDRTVAGHQAQGVYVTTSWDDGHVLDHQLATMLDSYNLPATFYIAPRNVELPARERLNDRGIQLLAEKFEIGGHTMRHIRLPSLPAMVARQEIMAGKSYLEDLIGTALRSFCYVGGCYGPEHRTMVREAGFTVARTVQRHRTDLCPAMQVSTTTHAYRHLVDGPAALRCAGYDPKLTARYFANWDELAIANFDTVVATGGVYHLWGHSWEIAANRDWDRLERVLAHISRRPEVRYVSNGDLPTVEVMA
jgi:peptidoglycan-N-acetylglucosamine deacetylase